MWGVRVNGTYSWSRFTKTKVAEIGLTSIYGIGRSASRKYLQKQVLNQQKELKILQKKMKQK